MAINTAQMVETLKDVPEGSTVFVSYTAGRKGGPQSALESARARAEGMNLRHFTGRLGKVHKVQNQVTGFYFTVWVEERDSLTPGGTKKGNWRAFNPALGTLHHLEVLAKRA
jgi:hypothetical protein